MPSRLTTQLLADHANHGGAHGPSDSLVSEKLAKFLPVVDVDGPCRAEMWHDSSSWDGLGLLLVVFHTAVAHLGICQLARDEPLLNVHLVMNI